MVTPENIYFQKIDFETLLNVEKRLYEQNRDFHACLTHVYFLQ